MRPARTLWTPGRASPPARTFARLSWSAGRTAATPPTGGPRPSSSRATSSWRPCAPDGRGGRPARPEGASRPGRLAGEEPLRLLRGRLGRPPRRRGRGRTCGAGRPGERRRTGLPGPGRRGGAEGKGGPPARAGGRPRGPGRSPAGEAGQGARDGRGRRRGVALPEAAVRRRGPRPAPRGFPSRPRGEDRRPGAAQLPQRRGRARATPARRRSPSWRRTWACWRSRSGS